MSVYLRLSLVPSLSVRPFLEVHLRAHLAHAKTHPRTPLTIKSTSSKYRYSSPSALLVVLFAESRPLLTDLVTDAPCTSAVTRYL